MWSTWLFCLILFEKQKQKHKTIKEHHHAKRAEQEDTDYDENNMYLMYIQWS